MFNKLSKQSIESLYNISEYGTIQNPGKFEGQTWVTEVAYNLSMNGDSDYELEYMQDGIGEYVSLIKLTSEEQTLVGAYGVLFVQDQYGFCTSELLTEDEFNAILSEYELE